MRGITAFGWLALLRTTTHCVSLVRIGGQGHAAMLGFSLGRGASAVVAVLIRTNQFQSRSHAVSRTQA